MSELLTSRILAPKELSDHEFSDIFSLFSEYFYSNKDIFQRDLLKKDWIILLEKSENQSIKGFTSIGYLDLEYCGSKLRTVFSGDTIIDRRFWNTFELSKQWIQTVLERCKLPDVPMYWLLLSSGYRTYRFLPTFYKEFYPRFDQKTPEKIQELKNILAKKIYGDNYRQENGVVQFKRGASPLIRGMAKVEPGRLNDPHVAFFLEKNPSFANGDELVCITEIKDGNYTRAGQRMLLR